MSGLPIDDADLFNSKLSIIPNWADPNFSTIEGFGSGLGFDTLVCGEFVVARDRQNKDKIWAFIAECKGRGPYFE